MGRSWARIARRKHPRIVLLREGSGCGHFSIMTDFRTLAFCLALGALAAGLPPR